MNFLDLQEEAYRNKIRHGLNTTDMNLEFCLLYSEVAKVYEAWKNQSKNLGLELADVAISLMGIAEMQGINLEKEIIEQQRINQHCVYRPTHDNFFEKDTSVSKTEELDNYVVSFNANGGVYTDGLTIKPQLITYGQFPAVQQPPVRDGYEFKGWSENADSNEKANPLAHFVDSDYTYYAIWTKI